MAETHALVAELVRSSNRIHRLSLLEKSSLLDRAEMMVRARLQHEGIDILSHREVINSLGSTASALRFGRASDDRVRSALLSAATAIRDFCIEGGSGEPATD